MDLQMILTGIYDILTSEEVFTFVLSLLAGIITFVANQVRPIAVAFFQAKRLKLESELSEQQLTVLTYLAELVVKEMEKINVTDKKEEGMKRLTAYAKARGLSFDEQELSTVIEAMVQELFPTTVVEEVNTVELVSE